MQNRPRLLPRTVLRRALPIVLLALAGCGNQADEALGIAVIGAPAAPFETGARLSTAAQLVRGATQEGLVGFDEEGRVVPALAERWIVTDDGLSYIFRLRDGAWGDGKPLTGESAALALRAALAAVRGTPLAGDIGGIETVIARTGRVVELQLDRPNPDLLQLLAQPEMVLSRSGRGTGPMRLRRDKDVAILLPVTPESRGLPAASDGDAGLRTVRLHSLSAARAVEAFDAGEVDAVLGGTFAGYPLARRTGLAAGKVQLDPVAGLFGLAVVRAEGFLARPENREALAMAVDRDALASAIDAEGWTPATRLVSAGLPGDSGAVGERWTTESLAQRQARAAQRVAQWRGGGAGPRLLIALPSGPGAELLFDRLAQDFRAIGIEARRVGPDAAADLRLVDQVARYGQARWFLGQLSCRARRGLCSETADVVAARAAAETDPAKRADLYSDAEAELTRANVFIPFGPPLRWSLLRRGVTGFAPNRWGVHPLIALAAIPR